MRWLVVLVSVLALPFGAEATLVEALTLSQLVERADVAAEVVARDQHVHWDSERRIVTDIQLEVLDSLKGDVGTDFVLTVFGGAIGDLGMRIEGEPTLVNGERYVVFARTYNNGWRPVGMSQGVMRIEQRNGSPETIRKRPSPCKAAQPRPPP